MLYLCLILMLLPQVTTAPVQEVPPEVAQPTYDQGPLRLELTGMREMRFWTNDPALIGKVESDLQLRFRIQGERIEEIGRVGNLILTDVVDDTGKALIDADTYKESDKTYTRAVSIPAPRLRESGLMVSARTKPTARGARTLKVLRGTVRVILGKETEKITVVNPYQFLGKTIVHPRLAELGIVIEVLPGSELEGGPPPERTIAFQYKTKAEHVQNTAFYDGWMRALPARDNWVPRQGGGNEQCQAFYFEPSAFNDEMQVVFEVHPTIDDLQLPIELEGFELP